LAAALPVTVGYGARPEGLVSERKQEDEYFERLDREAKERLRQKILDEEAQSAQVDLKTLHWHRCGKCGNAMETRVYRGLDIEVCQACGATLLDRGELEALAGADQGGLFVGIADLFRRE
jgi:hypothetical protein